MIQFQMILTLMKLALITINFILIYPDNSTSVLIVPPVREYKYSMLKSFMHKYNKGHSKGYRIIPTQSYDGYNSDRDLPSWAKSKEDVVFMLGKQG